MWISVRGFFRSIRGRLLLAFILVGLALVVSVSGVVFLRARDVVRNQIDQKLSALRETRAAQLMDWFDERRSNARAFAQDPDVVLATRAFKNGIGDLVLGASQTERLQYIRDRYLGRPEALGEDDSSPYGLTHKRFHPTFRHYLETYGYYDIFLVTLEGDIVYTVVKEDDYGTNLETGPYRQTNIGEVFRAALSLNEVGETVLVDFKDYAPSDEPAAFISTSIFDSQDEKIGVLIFQLPVDVINKVMNQHAGLGRTGETYVVGPDGLFRNTSRFIQRMGMEDTLLNPDYQVDTVAVQSALRGQAGTELITDYQGTAVLSAWQPLELQGRGLDVEPVRWALVAEIHASEAFEPVDVLLLFVFFVGLIWASGLVLASLYLSDQIARPIQRLTQVAARFAAGDWNLRAQATPDNEVGVLASTFNQMAEQLQATIIGLEQRVAERTRSLQAAAEVSQASSMVLEPQELIYKVVALVQDYFDLYYVGMFLLDDDGDFAVLQAGTGTAGQQMVSQGHRLEVGGASLVGQCIAKSEAQIAQDVGEAMVHFRNPLLPNTRAELALPLRSRGRTIGAMSIQSESLNAFAEADIAIMQTMADQVAVALDNARLFVSREAALAEMGEEKDVALGLLRQEDEKQRIYHAASDPDAPQREGISPEAIRQALDARRPVVVEGDAPALVAPIFQGDDVVGTLGIYDPQRQWTQEEIALCEAVVERMGLVAENRRLFERTRSRAEREQVLREISDQMQQAQDMEALMRITAHALNNVLGGSRAYVRLGLDDGKKEVDGTQNA